ncbi:DUF6188 family protein [Kitasatospora sp. NPDC049285]|uniref:DUF6188 family protein n=1 Tax=Kitasatospora sp. NPDC049285 TaxID=3157096 RepID=UPI003424BADD
MEESIAAVLSGRRVASLAGGDRLLVRLDGGLELTVENDFRLGHDGEVEHFYPALGLSPAGALARLTAALVTTARITPAGGLQLAFDSGHTLTVAPDPAPGTHPVHPWQLASPDGPLFTGGPGGDPGSDPAFP